MTGIAVSGRLLGAAGQAHADSVPAAHGARLPHAAAHAARPVAALGRHASAVRRVASAVLQVPVALATARPADPPAFLATPPDAATPGNVAIGAPASVAGPSRTTRHNRPGRRAGSGRDPVVHTGPRAVTGASEKASAILRTDQGHIPQVPRSLPYRAPALLPTVGNGGGQAPYARLVRVEPARRHAELSALLVRAAPPAVRTAADEPSFSPD